MTLADFSTYVFILLFLQSILDDHADQVFNGHEYSELGDENKILPAPQSRHTRRPQPDGLSAFSNTSAHRSVNNWVLKQNMLDPKMNVNGYNSRLQNSNWTTQPRQVLNRLIIFIFSKAKNWSFLRKGKFF